jgi:hypothetical protein
MAVNIIDSLTTVAEVCLLQGHNMNILADAASARIFSDDLISTVINNVIRFVKGNSMEDLESNIETFAINTLSVLALNNIMAEANYLDNWQYQDPFDKLRFYQMIETLKEDDDQSDVIPLYRTNYHLYNG